MEKFYSSEGTNNEYMMSTNPQHFAATHQDGIHDLYEYTSSRKNMINAESLDKYRHHNQQLLDYDGRDLACVDVMSLPLDHQGTYDTSEGTKEGTKHAKRCLKSSKC